MLLLGGHTSRFHTPFLEYINDPQYLWCDIIGVLYSTSLGQVGDSKEYNGSYKMTLACFEKKLIEKNKVNDSAT